MKKHSRLLSILLAMLLIIGSIGLSGIAFGEDEDQLPKVEEPKIEDQEKNIEDELAVTPTTNNNIDDSNSMGTGTLKIHKRIQRSPKHIHANLGNETFEVTLTGPLDSPDSKERTVSIHKRNNTGDHGDFDELPFGRYEISEVLSENYEDYKLVYAGNQGDVSEIIIDNNNATHNYWLINIPKVLEPDPEGQITIKKVVIDKEGVIEDNTKFEFIISELVDGQWEEVDKVSIYGNGSETVKELFDGQYKIEEINVPKGYTPQEASQIITLDSSSRKGEVGFTNIKSPPITWKSGKIIITKTQWGMPKGRLGIRLPENPNGITFILYDEERNEIDRATTKRVGLINGVATFDNLPEGNYILDELVPDGYTSSLKEEGKRINISKRHPLELVQVKNLKQPGEEDWTGEIEIQKTVYDQETESYLEDKSGFKFELYALNDDEETLYDEGTITVEDDGILTFTGLPEGVYRVKEVFSEEQEGKYLAEYSKDLIYLNEEDTPYQKVIIEVKNTKVYEEPWYGAIRIVKKVHSRSPISPQGFEFQLWQDNKQIGESKKTDVDGIVEFNGLAIGTYTIKEVNNKGFNPHFKGDNKVTIGPDNENNNKWEVWVTNYPIDTPPPETPFGKITVKKIVLNRGGNITVGNDTKFYFDLYKKLEDNSWQARGRKTIYGNGSEVFDNLEDGVYRVKESNINSDFELISENNIEVGIKENSKTIEFTNRRLPIPPPDDEPKDPKPDPKPEEPDDPIVDDEIEVVPPEPQPEPEPEPEPEEEEVVVVEPVPEAKPTLPKTGTASPFIYSGLGSVLLGLGIFLKKKEG